MSKVIKSFSLDIETVDKLEHYVNASVDAGLFSRSKVVNDAIVWFLSGDTAELVHNNERLMLAVKRANQAIASPSGVRKSWWRRLLGF